MFEHLVHRPAETASQASPVARELFAWQTPSRGKLAFPLHAEQYLLPAITEPHVAHPSLFSLHSSTQFAEPVPVLWTFPGLQLRHWLSSGPEHVRQSSSHSLQRPLLA